MTNLRPHPVSRSKQVRHALKLRDHLDMRQDALPCI